MYTSLSALFGCITSPYPPWWLAIGKLGDDQTIRLSIRRSESSRVSLETGKFLKMFENLAKKVSRKKVSRILRSYVSLMYHNEYWQRADIKHGYIHINYIATVVDLSRRPFWKNSRLSKHSRSSRDLGYSAFRMTFQKERNGIHIHVRVLRATCRVVINDWFTD